MYDRFTRGTPSNKGLYSGSGLGLSIIKQFIEELGGKVSVKSEVDKGTTFTCLIPVELPLAIEQSQKCVAKSNIDSTKLNIKILLVEDDLIAKTVGLNTLKNNFPLAQIDTAETGKTAIELATKNDYDLIFMDLGLPDMKGYKIATKIRSLKKNQLPIVALTAHDSTEVKNDCIKAGMNDAFSKPINDEKIKTIVGQWICKERDRAAVDSHDNKATKKDNSNKVITESQSKIIDWDLVIKSFGKEQAQKLLESFVKELATSQQEIAKAVKADNFETIAFIAHRIKGGSAYCGTEKLKSAATDLEVAAKNKRKKEISVLFDKLKVAINEVTENYVTYVYTHH